MKQSGYTLIELVVALAISAVLLALALPRYDSYEQHINLRNEAQKLANCMQAANSVIMAPAPIPDSSPAIAKVFVALTTTNGSIGCSYQPKDATSKNILTPVTGQSATAYFCSFVYGTSSNIGSSPSYSLSQLNRGQIDQITYGGVSMGSGNGQGQSFSLQISADSTATATNCNDPVVISVSALGSPIVISS